MPAAPQILGTTTVDPLQVVGLQRSAALARVQHFETTMHRRLGALRAQRYMRLYAYYSSQNLPPDNVEQPLGINYVRTIVDKHTSYLWGQWDQQKGRIVDYRVRPRPDLRGDAPVEDPTSKMIRQYLRAVHDANQGNALLLDASTNTGIFGDGFLRVGWDPILRRPLIESLLPEWVHCRWDVTNMDRLLEVILAYPIDRLDAQEKYGTSGNPAVNYNLINPDYVPGFGILWEHWTPTSWRRWIDDVLIAEGPNPYMLTDGQGNLYPGILPFIHVPNLRAGGEFFGYGDGELITFLQDEMNRKAADLGDAINNFAHPVVTIKGMSGQTDELSVGPDTVWDMGMNGEAELLQWKGAPPSVLEYLQLLKDSMFDTANMPDIAFGRMVRGGGGGSGGGSGGGGARGAVSGIALQIMLMPVIERARIKRIHWGLALQRLAHMVSFIHALMDPETLPFDYARYADYEIEPLFAEILPRDRMQSVSENVTLVQGNLRSRARALEDLGEANVQDELQKISGDMSFIAAVQAPAAGPVGTAGEPAHGGGQKGLAKLSGGKNADVGHGGDAALPESGGAPAAHPAA